MTKVDNPKKRVQDYKEKLLCGNCEQHLNRYESPFAGRIFHPYINDNADTFKYKDWLQKFIISVNWRLINSSLSNFDDIPTYQQAAVEDANQCWYDVLTDDNVVLDPYSHHMILLDDLELRTDPDKLPERWEWYRDRGTDETVVIGNSGTVKYYFKFPRLAFVSCIQPPRYDGFRNTEIQLEGKVEGSQRISRSFEAFLLNRVEDVFSITYSENRQDQITDWILDNPDRAANSESMMTWARAKKRQIENHDPSDYLDSDCPVCFTNHRINKNWPVRPITEEEAEELEEKSPGNFVFFKPIYARDELEHPVLSNNVACTIVFATEETIMQVAVYPDHGWIVEKEVEVTEEMDPVEIAELMWEETYSHHMEFIEQASI